MRSLPSVLADEPPVANLEAGAGLEERIVFALVADCGCGAVAGEDAGVVWEGQQAGFNGLDDLAGVSSGEIGAANAACEEGVAGD